MATIIRDGTSQDQRMLPALQAGYVRPDELDLPQLLDLGASHARLFAYHDADNRPAGDWQPLFAADAAALLAQMLVQGARRDALREEFRIFGERMRAWAMAVAPCPPPQEVPPYRLAAQWLEWRQSCARLGGEAARRLHAVLDGLLAGTVAPALAAVAAQLAAHDGGHGAKLAAAVGAAVPAVPPADAQNMQRLLNRVGSAFLNAQAVLRDTAAELFPAAQASGDHDPAFGLYLAFAHLFLKAKGRLDDYSQRHLRFYYDRILGFRPRPPAPDSAYLVLVPDGALAAAAVPKGTRFVGAEAEDGSRRQYAACDDIRVTDARVAALHTLHFEHDPCRSPENRLGYASCAQAGAIPLPGGKDYFPLFGVSRQGERRAVGSHARLGFAVASPMLRLGEGRRDIELRLHFAPRGDSLADLVAKLCAGNPEATAAGAFYRAFGRLWRIRLTTADGWREVADWVPGCSLVDDDVPADCLALRIRLPEDFPPVVDCRPQAHGTDHDAGNPVASFAIDPDAHPYPYGFLSGLALREVEIAVRVAGCRDLRLYNQHGELSAATPFLPFGPQPQAGAAYFVLGSAEAFAKRLTALALRVRWDGLPAGGLAQHYRGYGMGLDPASFRVAAGALAGGAWLPARKAERASLALFDGIDDEGCVRYDCGALLPFLHASVAEPDGAFGPQARDGFIRLSLAAPVAAFGHAAYGPLLGQALAHNAAVGSLGVLPRLFGARALRPVPEPPYTPTWSAVALDYEAHSRISLRHGAAAGEGGRLYHLHPFGVEALRPAADGDLRLIPAYAADAYLFIGLAATAPGGPLNLHFHLRNDSALDGEPPQITWQVLRAGRWQDLEAFRVLADSTRGFLASGVVTLDLPHDLSAAEPGMPGGLHWLRLAAKGAVAGLCHVHGVRTHGLRVERILGDDPAGPPLLPAGSIRAAAGPLPGIDAIEQPADSFGGAPPESLQALTVRASERLKHKQRAVTAWDFERLVLQRFPEIHKVKCFANTCFDADPSRRHRPGHLLIVVVPQRDGRPDPSARLTANALLLRDIESYLEGLASPFARIDVRNPAFEQVQARCAVRFRARDAAGMAIRRLNRDICNFISPWGAAGNGARFGWSLSCRDLQGHLRSLPYVAALWGLSLLRVAENGAARFLLHDTAADGAAATLAPLHPWSIAIPFRHHLIEAAADGREADDPGPWRSGIADLQIGGTFVVGAQGEGVQ